MNTTQVSTSQSRGVPEVTMPIVVGVDARGRSTSAVVWAAEEAEHAGRPLRLVTVAETDDGADDPCATHGLAGLARRLTLSDVQYVAVAGSPTEVLVSEAEGAHLLVVGRRGVGAAHRLLLGSTSLAVAGRSGVPVVVVPEPWIQPSMSTAPVIVGVASPLLTSGHVAAPGPEAAVLRHSFDRAARMRVPLIVVSAWEIPSAYAWSPTDVAAWRARHEAALAELLEPWRERFPDLEVVARCVAEEPEQALIDASRVSQLIVVGRHRGSHPRGLTLGGTTRGVLHRATRPVAVVPVEPLDAATREHDVSAWGPVF